METKKWNQMVRELTGIDIQEQDFTLVQQNPENYVQSAGDAEKLRSLFALLKMMEDISNDAG